MHLRRTGSIVGSRHRRNRPKFTDFGLHARGGQFWYDDATAEAFAEELCEGATEVTNIAIVSAPSVFVKIQEMKVRGGCVSAHPVYSPKHS